MCTGYASDEQQTFALPHPILCTEAHLHLSHPTLFMTAAAAAVSQSNINHISHPAVFNFISDMSATLI